MWTCAGLQNEKIKMKHCFSVWFLTMLWTVCGTVYASKGRLVVVSFRSLRLKTLGHNLVHEKQTLVLRLLCKFSAVQTFSPLLSDQKFHMCWLFGTNHRPFRFTGIWGSFFALYKLCAYSLISIWSLQVRNWFWKVVTCVWIYAWLYRENNTFVKHCACLW